MTPDDIHALRQRVQAARAHPLAAAHLHAAHADRQAQVARQVQAVRQLLATPTEAPEVPQTRFTPAHTQALNRGIQSLAVQPVTPIDEASVRVSELESGIRTLDEQLSGSRVALDQLLAQVRLACGE